MRSRPFTLLELMIAILLMAGLTVLVFVSANGIAASWERMTLEQRRFSELLTVDRTLDSLLANVVPFLWRDDDLTEADERPVFTGRPDEMGFASVGQIHSFASGGLIFVHLKVVDGMLVAYYQSRPLIHPTQPEQAAKISVLAEDIARIECRYADVSSEGDLVWLDEWDPDEERREIPLAVIIRVFWQSGREEVWLRRTAGNSQVERYGRWAPEP